MLDETAARNWRMQILNSWISAHGISSANEISAAQFCGTCRTSSINILCIKPSHRTVREPNASIALVNRPTLSFLRDYSAALYLHVCVNYMRVPLLPPRGKKSRKFRSTCLGNWCHLFMRSTLWNTGRLECIKMYRTQITVHQHVEILIIMEIKWR